ncbi:MAG TPA: hypothetical protein VF997_14585 [Polyangia bacterium]
MLGLGRELVGALAGSDVVPRLIAERPVPEWRLGLLTVLVGKEQARLRYAREPVGTARANAADIAAAWRKALDRLGARSRPPDELLPQLAAAYERTLARCDARGADRVPLVDVRAELAGYTRAQFAWDLARLKRERRLVVDGKRIEIGVATGHATAHRSRVVWLEDDGGGGAWYESFRMIPMEAHR